MEQRGGPEWKPGNQLGCARDLDVSLIKPETEHESFSDMGGVGVRSVLADPNNARARFKKLNAVANLRGEVEVANIEVRTDMWMGGGLPTRRQEEAAAEASSLLDFQMGKISLFSLLVSLPLFEI
jgi:hypothetical protein